MMKSLFDQMQIGNMTLKNRIIRSATFEGMTENQTLNDQYEKVYEDLARGNVGLIKY